MLSAVGADRASRRAQRVPCAPTLPTHRSPQSFQWGLIWWPPCLHPNPDHDPGTAADAHPPLVEDRNDPEQVPDAVATVDKIMHKVTKSGKLCVSGKVFPPRCRVVREAAAPRRPPRRCAATLPLSVPGHCYPRGNRCRSQSKSEDHSGECWWDLFWCGVYGTVADPDERKGSGPAGLRLCRMRWARPTQPAPSPPPRRWPQWRSFSMRTSSTRCTGTGIGNTETKMVMRTAVCSAHAYLSLCLRARPGHPT